jgi:serine/threonine protein kinase
MGTVYAAIDIALDRKVAAKVMREELLGDPHAAERFEQEARTAARFAHPNVVTVHDFGIASGTFAFLVMELLEGESLRGRLDRVGRLDIAETRTIMRQLTAAVEAAHRQQLLHRDLKPENLFLARSDAGEVTKVVDFGIAKSFAGARVELTTTLGATKGGVLVGTPMYMAPEQLDGGTARASWDLWAMALLACEMLTGMHPFARTPVWAVPGGGAGVEALLARRLSDCSAAVQAFFVRALALDPSVRPPSPRELLAAFEEAVDAAR